MLFLTLYYMNVCVFKSTVNIVVKQSNTIKQTNKQTKKTI